MRVILLLLFHATTVLGHSTDGDLSLESCLNSCFSSGCKGDCYYQHLNLSTFRSKIQPDVNADANVSLHCATEGEIMIKFNSGLYVLQQSISADEWHLPALKNGSVVRFDNLTEDTKYRFRLWRVTEKGISRPETSEFSTYPADYKPLEVQSMSLVKFVPDEINECFIGAEIAFEPGKDRSCHYRIKFDGEEHNLQQFNWEGEPDFRFNVTNLQYSTAGYKVNITARNGDWSIKSNESIFIFDTPSCLKFNNNNLSICAPEAVRGLQVEHTHLKGNIYDIKVNWSKPVYEPDNYTVEVNFISYNRDYVNQEVPGNETETTFTNVELESEYEVKIAANSPGGMSGQAYVIKSFISETTAPNETYHYMFTISGMAILMIIAILVAMTWYIRYCKQKKSMKIASFEARDPKMSAMGTTKRLSRENYEDDVNSISLIHDKFELNPKSLKIKRILGSGAYGIVRLGSLTDEFGNVKNVAVKMLKDNPSVEDIQSFHKEISIMKFTGEHPNIVSLIGCCNLHSKPILVVEYCCKGDLETYLRTIWQNMASLAFNHATRFKVDAGLFTDRGIKYLSGGHGVNYQNVRRICNGLYDIQQDAAQNSEAVTSNDLLNFARQVATGMEFLSSNRIVHRDLAARNVLVCAEKVVKISDFGLSRDVYQENLYKKKGNGKLPIKWMAIEALTHQIYTTSSDVWSFGILLWEIVTMGAIPYPGIPANAILNALKSGHRMERPTSCNAELYVIKYDIMLSCWNVRPQGRPTFTELRESLDRLISLQSDSEYLNIEGALYDGGSRSRTPED